MPGRHVPSKEVPPRLYDRVSRLCGLAEMPVIVADEIAQQIDAMPEETPDADVEKLTYPNEFYGVIAPPFPAFFVEARTQVDGVDVYRGAVLYDRTESMFGTRPEGTHWCVHVYPFIWSPLIGRVEDYGSPTVVLHIDKDGKLIDKTTALTVLFAGPSSSSWSEAMRNDAAYAAASLIPMVLKAIEALHRRSPVDHVTPSTDRLQKRRGELDRHSYYRLKVQPTTPQRREDFRNIGTPDKPTTREHTVRGHFRWYGESGLFGKYKNTMVWIPEHERGDDTLGTIRKDYEVGED